MKPEDPRRGKRYEVRLACRVESLSGVSVKLSGVTLNVSRSGLLASFDATDAPTPQVGQTARILLELPQAADIGNRCVECGGRVVRTGDSSDPHSFAFEFRRIQFRALATALLGA
jgi:hypothetical protein